MQEPVEYQVAERRVFGLAPKGLLLALAAVLAVLGALLAARGLVLAGALFLAAAALLGYLWLEQSHRRRARLKDVASLLRGTAGAWASAGPELARIRLEVSRVNKERARVLYELEQGDETAEARLEALDVELAECVERANAVLDRSRERASDERLAAQRTMVVPPEHERSTS